MRSRNTKHIVIGGYSAKTYSECPDVNKKVHTVGNNLFTGKQHHVGPPPPPKKGARGLMINKDSSKNWNSFLFCH